MITFRDLFPFLWLVAGEPVVVDVAHGDAQVLADIHAKSFHKGWSVEDLESMITDRSIIGHVLRRRDNGPVIGFILSRVAAGEGEILTIALSPVTRGRRLSKRLLATHLNELRSRHVEKLFLEVEGGNNPALALYKRHGFVEIGRRKGYYKTPEGRSDALMMQRDLTV